MRHGLMSPIRGGGVIAIGLLGPYRPAARLTSNPLDGSGAGRSRVYPQASKKVSCLAPSYDSSKEVDALNVMSVLSLSPRKLGSFEEYTITLSRSLARLGGRSVLVFTDPPPSHLLPLYVEAGASIETKPFDPFDPASAD